MRNDLGTARNTSTEQYCHSHHFATTCIAGAVLTGLCAHSNRRGPHCAHHALPIKNYQFHTTVVFSSPARGPEGALPHAREAEAHHLEASGTCCGLAFGTSLAQGQARRARQKEGTAERGCRRYQQHRPQHPCDGRPQLVTFTTERHYNSRNTSFFGPRTVANCAGRRG